MVGSCAAERARLVLSELMKVLMIFGNEAGVLSGRIGIWIDWSMRRSWAWVKAWRGDRLLCVLLATWGGKRGNIIALSVPPVSDSKCWRRERVDSISTGVIKDCVKTMTRRLRGFDSEAVEMTRSWVFSSLSIRDQSYHS